MGCAVHRDSKPWGSMGSGTDQSSWSGRPPKARRKKPRGRCSSLSRATGALQRLAGGQVRSRWGQVHPPTPERHLPRLALSREFRVIHRPGVPAPCLPAVLGHSSGSRSLPRRTGSGGQLHRLSPSPRDRYGPAGPTKTEGSPQNSSWRLRLGKSTPSSPSSSEWTLMGRKRLERKALAFAGRPRFAREKCLPPTSPLPAAPRAGL